MDGGGVEGSQDLPIISFLPSQLQWKKKADGLKHSEKTDDSRSPLSRTLAISNPLLSPLGLITPLIYCSLSKTPFSLDNFWYPLRVQVSGSQLY